MTLRHRLLLVYLIVMLLSVATVGVAIYELNRTQNIYGPLLVWYDVVSDAQRLRAIALPAGGPADQQDDFEGILTDAQRRIASVSAYRDVDYIRDWHVIRLREAYRAWKGTPPADRAEQAQRVSSWLDKFSDAVDEMRIRLNEEVEQQRTNKWALLAVATGLAGLHVVLIGWLLRRWLLWPMERLNRQVEALAKDQPPPEPLLTSPLEMARLAAALDRARESLQDYRRQLIDNERLTMIGQFAAQLAHNLRNPLASIRAAAQVTSRHERGNDYVCERMDEVVACVDRLNHWVVGLMEVARREATPTAERDVMPLLHRVHEAVRQDLSVKEMTLKVDAPEGELRCAHDPATLEQSLIAMVVNAIEASPLGGNVVLRAERIEGEKGREGEGRDSGFGVQGSEVCRISVEDGGCGLPAEGPERIFEFSYSTKQKGMGLGLALARLALERQGGRAHACNRPEGGARVYVDLPVAGSENGAR